MSAIWGIIDFNNKAVLEEEEKKMQLPYKNYKIDCFQNLRDNELLMGYGGQYFTKESPKEAMPIVDKKQQGFFIADVILDNREELLHMLDVDLDSDTVIPDGEIMHEIWKKYGPKSLEYYLGTYALAYYDRKAGELLLATDALGSRCLYYATCDGRVIFSTLLQPIVNVLNPSPELNYRWITDYLAVDNLALYTEYEETHYKGIFKVGPGEVVRISREGKKKESYWTPLEHIQPIKKINDEDAKNEFITIFKDSINGTLRSCGNTGVLLSGGLDSTSVACIAAKELEKKQDQLFSYTSVPVDDYHSDVLPEVVTNERKVVSITEKYLNNLIPTYIQIPSENAWDGTVDLMKLLEVPFKSLQNLKWMTASLNKAREDGCKIVLTGQCGNTTISLGDFNFYFNTLLKQGHFSTLIKEINLCNRKYKLSRKKIYTNLVRGNIPHIIKRKVGKDEIFGKQYVNTSLLEEYKVKKRFIDKGMFDGSFQGITIDGVKKCIVDKISLSHAGEFETKLSLITGVMMRDPTKDKRIIEFCLKMPVDQFVKNGIPRRLVREYLKEYLPSEVCCQVRYKGVQSADVCKRLELQWNRIYADALKSLQTKSADKLLDSEYCRKELEKYRDELPKEYYFDFIKLMYSILLCNFIEAI